MMMHWLLPAAFLATAGALSAGSVPAPDGVPRPGPVPWCERIELRSRTGATAGHFAQLLDEVAAGWNAGDARRAAACFTEDAVYSAAGDSTARQGRVALYDFFGG